MGSFPVRFYRNLNLSIEITKANRTFSYAFKALAEAGFLKGKR